MTRFTKQKRYATFHRPAQAGRLSQEMQENSRLAAALTYGPIRPVESYLVFEIRTRNPRTGADHLIEIKSDPGDGNNLKRIEGI